MTGIPVQVLSPDEVHERSARFHADRAANPGMWSNDWELAEQAGRDTALFLWRDDLWFNWLCPGCGWGAPRWVNSGTRDRPTLTPSLGCGGWRRGTCPEGHYWMRDGFLERA